MNNFQQSNVYRLNYEIVQSPGTLIRKEGCLCRRVHSLRCKGNHPSLRRFMLSSTDRRHVQQAVVMATGEKSMRVIDVFGCPSDRASSTDRGERRKLPFHLVLSNKNRVTLFKNNYYILFI